MRNRISGKNEISFLSINLFFSLIDKGIISVIPLKVINNFFLISKKIVGSDSLVLKINSIFFLIGKAMINSNSLVLEISSIFPPISKAIINSNSLVLKTNGTSLLRNNNSSMFGL